MKLLSICLFLEEEGLGLPETQSFLEKVIPNFWAFLVQFIAFIIMILIVIKLAYKPVSKFIAERKAYVEGNLNNAKTKNEEADKYLAETKANLQKSQKEAIQIIQDAKKVAEKEHDEMLEATKQEIASKHAKAQEDIKIEQEKAIKEMHDDVVDIALEATKNILGREVNASDDKAMLDDFVNDLIEEKQDKGNN